MKDWNIAGSSEDLYENFIALVRDEPVGITVDGKLECVVMTKELYDSVLASLGASVLYDKLAEAEEDIRNGRVYPIDAAFAEAYDYIDSLEAAPTAEELESMPDDADAEAASTDERLSHDEVSGAALKSLPLGRARAELYAHLAQARDDIRNGRVYTSEEVAAMTHSRVKKMDE